MEPGAARALSPSFPKKKRKKYSMKNNKIKKKQTNRRHILSAAGREPRC